MLSRARFPDPWSNFHHATRPEFNCAIANAGTMQSCSTTVKLNVTSLLLNSNSHLSRSLAFVTYVLGPNVLALAGIPHPALSPRGPAGRIGRGLHVQSSYSLALTLTLGHRRNDESQVRFLHAGCQRTAAASI